MDRLLDEARTGPVYLRQPAIAHMVVEAIRYNATTLRHYELHAFAVMPNHVHMLVTPAIAVPDLAKSLKGITAKRANIMLSLTGQPFWQDESFDRCVRNPQEFESIKAYIEWNPVTAYLVPDPADYRWSSAWGADALVRAGPPGPAPDSR
jgi:REP element-mobilizing transposase RayT